MSKHRKHPLGTGKGRHGSEIQPATKRPPGEIKPIISKSKHGKMIHADEYHDTDEQMGPADTTGIRRAFHTCLWLAAILAIFAIAMCSATVAQGQTDFYSPFHFVVTTPQPGSASITDIYHVPTHVVITEATVSIGVDTEGGQRFNYAIQGVERETDRVRYIITDGLIIHTTNKEGECVTWISSKFQWRLYSFLPKLVEIEN